MDSKRVPDGYRAVQTAAGRTLLAEPRLALQLIEESAAEEGYLTVARATWQDAFDRLVGEEVPDITIRRDDVHEEDFIAYLGFAEGKPFEVRLY